MPTDVPAVLSQRARPAADWKDVNAEVDLEYPYVYLFSAVLAWGVASWLLWSAPRCQNPTGAMLPSLALFIIAITSLWYFLAFRRDSLYRSWIYGTMIPQSEKIYLQIHQFPSSRIYIAAFEDGSIYSVFRPVGARGTLSFQGVDVPTKKWVPADVYRDPNNGQPIVAVSNNEKLWFSFTPFPGNLLTSSERLIE